jgi:hypothetical protein
MHAVGAISHLLVVCVTAVLCACIQLPTEKQDVPDLRPQLSFSVPVDMDAQRFRVIVDNLDMGALSSYSSGEAALRVLSGAHVVRIESAGRTVHEERVYLGEGAVRQLQVRPQ